MKLLMTLALIAPLAACATVTRGSSQAFTVESEPSGAAVTTSTGLTCPATPCTFAKIERDAEFTVTASMPGYRSSTHNVTHQTSGGGGAGMAGNLLLGGIIGAAIDANSGATQELVPNPLRITLQREETPAVAEAAPAVATPEATATPASETPQAAPAVTTPATATAP
jgi:hypothetical protein